MTLRHVVVFTFIVAVFTPVPQADAWWAFGHKTVDLAAVRLLPDDVPLFFRQSGETMARYAPDPDMWADRRLSALRSVERPGHYIDLELLQGKPLPQTRTEFERLCDDLKVPSHHIGWLPYTIQEWYERLLIAFAQHRLRPQDRDIQAKVRYIAAILSHYAADATNPLHTTIHYDGRALADNTSPRTGIHMQVDALPGVLRMGPGQIGDSRKVKAAKDPWRLTLRTIRSAHRLVDRVYALERSLPPTEGAEREAISGDVRDFTLERMTSAARFTAQLWYTAWRRSAEHEIPVR